VLGRLPGKSRCGSLALARPLHQRLALRQAVGEQHAMLLPRDRLRRDGARRGARPLEEDELDRDDVAALVQHLEVGVLRVRPGSPQTTGLVANGSGAPLRSTRLPLLSISSCCRYAGSRCSACE
jgi:hypothetical protein